MRRAFEDRSRPAEQDRYFSHSCPQRRHTTSWRGTPDGGQIYLPWVFHCTEPPAASGKAGIEGERLTVANSNDSGNLSLEVFMNSTMEKELVKELENLDPVQQRRVLEYARSLAQKGRARANGRTLAKFAGTISSDDLAAMKKAIETECERIHPDEW